MQHSQKESQCYLICKEKRQITNSLKKIFFTLLLHGLLTVKNENDPFCSPGIINLLLLIKYLLTLNMQSTGYYSGSYPLF